ncbi:DUF397 domain-containing protein [Streptomyces sp. APSN-46.1]|uniref:DUF397 domain-containing protein n=1 Tax=Streptomyces sp. APSN-46.1 TaxID=2929049 RepID=UPI001FB51A63|nr:DUF397 domain-containing protein [Streptomyces sp. APSN-46.1]MCJ1677674.1 DUF397 domain-containing protein [Streptomyces sp. APSN-46.1]
MNIYPPLGQDQWVKSSYSGPDGGNCVEVADCTDTIRVRDSKVTGGPELAVAPTAWGTFLGGIMTAG